MIFSLNFLWVCVDWRKPKYNSRAHRNLSLHLLRLFRCLEMTYRSCRVQIKRETKITNKFGSFACWKARLTRARSFQGTSTFLACSAGVLLGRVNAKKLAIVHSTNQFQFPNGEIKDAWEPLVETLTKSFSNLSPQILPGMHGAKKVVSLVQNVL